MSDTDSYSESDVPTDEENIYDEHSSEAEDADIDFEHLSEAKKHRIVAKREVHHFLF